MIIPSIDLQNGQTVQLVGGKDHALDAGDPRPLLQRFARVGEVAVIDLDAAMGKGDHRALIEELCTMAPIRVGGGIRDLETARRWLDAGASKIIIGTAAKRDLLAQLPRERVIAALDAVDGEVVVEGWQTKTGASIVERMVDLRDLVGGFLVTFVEREGRMGGTDLERVKELVEAAGDARLTVAGGVTTPDELATLDALGVDAQVGMALYTGKLDLAEAFTAPLSSDREDGLWSTVVVDRRGEALGQCFSKLESVREAIESGTGVYWSRKRGLWKKGATSGDTQRLVHIEPDCDRDCLRFVVEQEGAGFCHLGTDTCWGDRDGLAALEATIRQRRREAPEGSYTRRLFTEEGLLGAKLVEEAGELRDAATKDDVVHEAADVIYFAMVAMARAGVSLAEVEDELDRRSRKVSRRGGDRKPSDSGPVRQGDGVVVGQDVVLAKGDVKAPGDERAAERSGVEALDEMKVHLRRVRPADVDGFDRQPVDDATLRGAQCIVDEVAGEGDVAVRRYGERFQELAPGDPIVLGPADLDAALARLEPDVVALLERTAARIRHFAEAQRQCLTELSTDLADGGRGGHRVLPVKRAGCYAPGGRYPLPSSVLMTAVTARVAGVEEVWVASPKPTDVTLGAAAVAGADAMLVVGGAHAISAMAYGTDAVKPCDVIVGPGNKWVTAAKQLVVGRVGIDMLAGPSELLAVVDDSVDPALVAADLLAQAEHDPEATPILVSYDDATIAAVETELRSQLASLPTADVARAALANGFAVLCESDDEVVSVCDRLAPEHLQLGGARAEALADRLRCYGALFVGERSGEVLGDYGAGPNHVLPTGGSGRHATGLSVFTFLRPRTWLSVDDASVYAADAAQLGRLEGLEAHARAADRRGE